MEVWIHVFLVSILPVGPSKQTTIPIWQVVGWAPEPVRTIWRSEHSSPYRDSKPDPSVIHPLARRYIDCAKVTQ
jgi:hypothetical protein